MRGIIFGVGVPLVKGVGVRPASNTLARRGKGGSGMRSLPPEHRLQKATMLCNYQLTVSEQGTSWDSPQCTRHRKGTIIRTVQPPQVVYFES